MREQERESTTWGHVKAGNIRVDDEFVAQPVRAPLAASGLPLFSLILERSGLGVVDETEVQGEDLNDGDDDEPEALAASGSDDEDQEEDALARPGENRRTMVSASELDLKNTDTRLFTSPTPPSVVCYHIPSSSC